MPPVVFEPAIPERERRQTQALDRGVTGICGPIHPYSIPIKVTKMAQVVTPLTRTRHVSRSNLSKGIA